MCFNASFIHLNNCGKLSLVSYHVSIATCLVAGVIFSIAGMSGAPFIHTIKMVGPYIGVAIGLPLIIYMISTCKVKFCSQEANQKEPEPIIEPQTPVSIAIQKQRDALEEWFKRDVSNPGDENWDLHASNSRTEILKAIENIPENDRNEVWVFSPGDLEPLEELAKSFKTVRLLGSSPKIDSKENCVRIDFLKNVRDEIDRLFKMGLPKDQCLVEFNKLKNRQFNFTQKFPKSRPDCIVCSLVMTEFHAVERYFSEIFEEIYSESPPESLDLYKEICLQWMSVLANLIKSGGVVYFADTIKKYRCGKDVINAGYQGINTIHFNRKDELEKMGLKGLKTENWLWTLEDKFHWGVEALILKKEKL